MRLPSLASLLVVLSLLLPTTASAARWQARYGGPIHHHQRPRPHVVHHPRPAPVVPLGARFSSRDLDRITVGNQAGVIKIEGRDHQSVLYCKSIPGCDMRGIDGTAWAPITAQDRRDIFGALDIGPDELGSVAENLMLRFGDLDKYPAVGLLGVIGAGSGEDLDPTTAARIRGFLEQLLDERHDVRLRRLAVLSLAVIPTVDDREVASIINFMTASHNAWETFTTQQFFQYHHDYLANRQDFLGRVAASGNPYADDILKDFQ